MMMTTAGAHTRQCSTRVANLLGCRELLGGAREQERPGPSPHGARSVPAVPAQTDVSAAA